MIAPRHQFHITFHDDADGRRLAIHGEFDAGAVASFDAGLEDRAATNPRIVLCLRHVTVIDSSALGALVRATARARSEEHSLEVHAPLSYQQDLIEITGLDSLIDVTKDCQCSEDEAPS